VNVAVDPSLGRCRWIGPNVTRIAMRQVEREKVGFLLDPANHHQGFAKISLGVARCVVQRDKHLPPAALLLAHVILDDGVAAGEPVLVPQPIKNPLDEILATRTKAIDKALVSAAERVGVDEG
jgi:hypothetical protein